MRYLGGVMLIAGLIGGPPSAWAQGAYKQIAQALFVAQNVAPIVCPEYQVNMKELIRQMYIAQINEKSFEPGGEYANDAQEAFDFYTEGGRRNKQLTCSSLWAWLGDSGQQLIERKR